MLKSRRLVTIVALFTSSLFLYTCSDIQKVRPYIDILHTIEFIVATTDGTNTTAENGTIGYYGKVNENGTIQNSIRLTQSNVNCNDSICTPSTSLGYPYLAHTVDHRTHFLYSAFTDDTFNSDKGSGNLIYDDFDNEPHLTIYYGELGHDENNGAMTYNGGSMQILEEGKGAYGGMTATGIYPWVITTLDTDDYHNDKRMQLKVRLFPGTAWTIGYTKLVGDTSDPYKYDDNSVHFAYKSTDNDTCNYVRVGIIDGGTGLSTLVGPISIDNFGSIGDNAITSCDVAMGEDGEVIVVVKGCEASAGSDAGTYYCSSERRVTAVYEHTLTGSTFGSGRLIVDAQTDENEDLTLINVLRDTVNSKWVYVFENDNESNGNNIGLGEFIATKYGTVATNYAAYGFGLSSGTGAGTIFDFLKIDSNRFLTTFIDEDLAPGESLYGGIVKTDGTIDTNSSTNNLTLFEDYSNSGYEINESKMAYMDNKLFTLTVIDTGEIVFNTWDALQGIQIYATNDALDNTTTLVNAEDGTQPAIIVSRTIDITPDY